MAVSINLSLTQLRQNSSTKTSVVGVSVVVTYDGGSHNTTINPGPLLTLYVDGVIADSRYVGFNKPVYNSGSESIYYNEIEVEHDKNGRKTLNMTASYETGVSSGTVYSSASLPLTPFDISDSGGGDNTGGSGSGSGGETSYHTIYISQGDNTEIIAHRYDNGKALTNGSIVQHGTLISVICYMDPGYSLVEFTIDGSSYPLSKFADYYVNDDVVIRSSAVRDENYYFVSVSKIGDVHFDVSYMDQEQNGLVVKIPNGGYVKAGNPVFADFWDNTDIIVTANGEPVDTSMGWWQWNINCDLDLVASSSSGEAIVNISAGDNTDIIVFRRDTYEQITDGALVPRGTKIGIVFRSDPGYERILYINDERIEMQNYTWGFSVEENLTILAEALFTASGVVFIDDEAGFNLYEIYIDDGTSWNLYEPFIDNGVEWVPYS